MNTNEYQECVEHGNRFMVLEYIVRDAMLDSDKTLLINKDRGNEVEAITCANCGKEYAGDVFEIVW